MKKTVITFAAFLFVAISASVLFIAKGAFSDLMIANVEVLANVIPDGNLCYRSLQDTPGLKTLYCPECKYIKGAPYLWSLTDYCDEVIE